MIKNYLPESLSTNRLTNWGRGSAFAAGVFLLAGVGCGSSSNPAADVTGLGPFVHQKHWGCRGSLIIDARIKPHHAPPLIEDPEVTRRVDSLFAKNGPLGAIG